MDRPVLVTESAGARNGSYVSASSGRHLSPDPQSVLQLTDLGISRINTVVKVAISLEAPLPEFVVGITGAGQRACDGRFIEPEEIAKSKYWQDLLFNDRYCQSYAASCEECVSSFGTACAISCQRGYCRVMTFGPAAIPTRQRMLVTNKFPAWRKGISARRDGRSYCKLALEVELNSPSVKTEVDRGARSRCLAVGHGQRWRTSWR
jgi:hypothetical protein